MHHDVRPGRLSARSGRFHHSCDIPAERLPSLRLCRCTWSRRCSWAGSWCSPCARRPPSGSPRHRCSRRPLPCCSLPAQLPARQPFLSGASVQKSAWQLAGTLLSNAQRCRHQMCAQNTAPCRARRFRCPGIVPWRLPDMLALPVCHIISTHRRWRAWGTPSTASCGAST